MEGTNGLSMITDTDDGEAVEEMPAPGERTYSISPDVYPSTAVVLAVADELDRDELDLPPLGDAIDPDALDSLLRTASSDVSVTFRYAGFEIDVGTDGVELLSP